MLLGQAGKIKIGEDVAQQKQPLEAVFLEHASGLAGMTGLCTEVQVGEDQRVVNRQIHAQLLAKECYEVMNIASKLVQWGNY